MLSSQILVGVIIWTRTGCWPLASSWYSWSVISDLFPFGTGGEDWGWQGICGPSSKAAECQRVDTTWGEGQRMLQGPGINEVCLVICFWCLGWIDGTSQLVGEESTEWEWDGERREGTLLLACPQQKQEPPPPHKIHADPTFMIFWKLFEA